MSRLNIGKILIKKLVCQRYVAVTWLHRVRPASSANMLTVHIAIQKHLPSFHISIF